MILFMNMQYAPELFCTTEFFNKNLDVNEPPLILCSLYIYYQIIQVHKRVIKLLLSAKSGPYERDIEPFRAKINSSTALAMVTMQGSDLQKFCRPRLA